MAPSPGFTLILSNGTVWPITPGHYEAQPFSLDVPSELSGSFVGTMTTVAYVFTAAAFANYSASAGGFGTIAMNATDASAEANWTSSPGPTGVIVVYLQAGDFVLVFANLDPVASAVVHVTSPVESLEEET